MNAALLSLTLVFSLLTGQYAPTQGGSQPLEPQLEARVQKLGKQLPGLKRRPYPGPLGERIFNEISADAWSMWVEHCKMILNEYRIHSADQNAMKMLMEQCELFLFGEGGIKHPEGYVPEKR